MAQDILRRAEFAAKSEISFESQVVTDLLRHYRLLSAAPGLRRLAAANYGSSGLMLPTFLEWFSSFPVHLATRRVPKATAKRLACTWVSSAQFLDLYNDALAEAGDIRQEYFGLICSWPYLNTIMVLSDYPYAAEDLGTFTIFRTANGHFFWEPFAQFVTRLRWRPQTDELSPS